MVITVLFFLSSYDSYMNVYDNLIVKFMAMPRRKSSQSIIGEISRPKSALLLQSAHLVFCYWTFQVTVRHKQL